MRRKYKIALIGTYPELSEIFLEAVRESDLIEGISIHASFDEAVKRAKELEGELDAVLSRGGTAEYLRKGLNIPVIFIPITPYDVVKALLSLPRKTGRVAIIHYARNILNIADISALTGIEILEYVFTDYQDIETSLREAEQQGIHTVIGGDVTARIAREQGMTAVVISGGQVAVRHALEETIQVIEERQKEREAAAQYEAAFTSLSEGIAVLDERKQVTVFNQAAKNILGRDYRKGDFAGDDILSHICLQMYQEGSSACERSEVRRIKKNTYAVTYSPVISQGKFIGLVCRYEDVTQVEALEHQIRRETRAKGFTAKHSFQDIISISPQMEQAITIAKAYASTDSSILIEGESGTGKELFAQSIHNASGRSEGPFVAVNCTAIPENLLESELFGYAPGAFTGAQKEGKAGLFEMAHRGTIFLDEIGEVSMQLQASLLRVLQEREVRRVGGNNVIPVDVRVISATNRDLWGMAQAGTFRPDLYYRLNVFHIEVPPLRNRTGDLRLLAETFAGQKGQPLDDFFFERIIPVLESYRWPGNVRQMQSVMERYLILKNFHTMEKMEAEQLRAVLGLNEMTLHQESLEMPQGGSLKEMTEQLEYEIVRRTLEACGGNQQDAAEQLKIGKTTLWRKLNPGSGGEKTGEKS